MTFAALFALALTGFSVIAWLRAVFAFAGANWLMLLIGPTIVVGLLAKKEPQWIPEAEQRRRWAWGLVLGSIAVALAGAWLRPERPPPASGANPTPSAVRPVGPRSK